MASKGRQDRARVTFAGHRCQPSPPYNGDKNLNIIYGINKAWRSLAELKEKLTNADEAILRTGAAVKPSTVVKVPSKVPRQRKVLRLVDKHRVDAVTSSVCATKIASAHQQRIDDDFGQPNNFGAGTLPVRSSSNSKYSSTWRRVDVEGPNRLSSSKVSVDHPLLLSEDRPSKLADEDDAVRIPPINMAWEPIVLNGPERNHNVLQRPASKETDVRSIKWMDADEMPTKTVSPSTTTINNAAQEVQGTTDPRNNRHMKRKVVVCTPEKIEKATINPYTWRKGRELIAKELGAFTRKPVPVSKDKCSSKSRSKRSVRTVSSQENGCHKSVEDSTEATDIGNNVNGQLDVERAEVVMDELGENAGPNERAKRAKKRSAKVASSKKQLAFEQSNTRQSSTPKLRHYDPTSVRRYIQKQRMERRKKADLDKVALETKSKDRREKLKELRDKQYGLLKTTKKADCAVDVMSKWPFAAGKSGRIPPSLTWIDLVRPKGGDMLANNANDDFAYKRLMSGGRSNRASGWRFPRESSSSGDERMSSSSNASAIRPCSAFESKKDLRNRPAFKQPEISKSNQVSERLKVLSEESRRTVDDLLARMIQSKTKNVETKDVIDGRVAKLESLKQQALSLQSAIDEETQRLNSKFQVPAAPSQQPPILIHEHQDESPGALNVYAKMKSTETPGQSVVRQEKHESSLSEGLLTENELVESQLKPSVVTSPLGRSRTDEILQLVLASTVFASKPAMVARPSSRIDDVTYAQQPSRESNARNIDERICSRKSSWSERRNHRRENYAPNFEASPSDRTSASTELPDLDSVNRTTSNHTPTHSSSSFSTFVDVRESAKSDLNRACIQDPFASPRKGVSGGCTAISSVAASFVELEDDNDEWALSEGPLSSVASDVGGEGSRMESVVGATTEPSVHVVHLDEASLAESSKLSISKIQESEGQNVLSSLEVERKLQNREASSANKMSPNALRLRMSAELTYLDTVHESLGQITDMERVRAVSLAQQEAVALAQVVQVRTGAGQQIHSDAMTSNLRLMQSQADAAKLSAEATKLMAETNGILVASSGGNAPLLSQETVAAATAAAVTAALSHLQLNVRRHKDRANTFLSNLSSSDHRSQLPGAESEGSLQSQDEWGSGDSQQSIKLKSQSLDADQMKTEDEEKKSSSVVPEELLSEGPLSPATSSDIREDISPSREASEAGADHESFTEDEELSFRALLPSEGHLRSSRRRPHDGEKKSHNNQQLQPPERRIHAESPSSDDQRSSLSSEVLLLERDKADGRGVGDQLDDVPLFSSEESLRRFTVSMVKQYIQEEAVRTQHQQAVHKLRSKALVDKANVELAWFQLQKKHYQIKGQDDKIPPLFKKDVQGQETETSSQRGDIMQGDQSEALPAGEITLEVDPDQARVAIVPKVLQGLKKLQASKRYLTRREQKLHLRRKHVEELLNWQRILDNEEVRVREMENMALTMLVPTTVDTSVVVATMIEGKSVQHPQVVSVESVGNDLSTSVDDAFQAVPEGEELLDKKAGDVSPSVLSAHRSPTSVVLRSPLTPQRSKTRIRRESSGSEDSCTVSQSETTSELSDIEGRVHALKEDLRRRKVEAERLRREQRRKNKERLRAQEASLLRQIDAYDKFIAQTRLDLQKELELQADLGGGGGGGLSAKAPSVRPVIKQPKVAESKRIQRQTCFDGSGSPEVRSEEAPSSRTGSRESELSTSLESGEESIFDSPSHKSLLMPPRETFEGELKQVSLSANEEYSGAKKEELLSDEIGVEEEEEREHEDEKEVEEEGEKSGQVSVHDETLSFNLEIVEDVSVVVTGPPDDSSSVYLDLALNLEENSQDKPEDICWESSRGDGDEKNVIASEAAAVETTATDEDGSRRTRLVDDITKIILEQLIRTELSGQTEAVVAARPQSTNDVVIPQTFVQRFCDDLMSNLLNEAVVDCVRIHGELESAAASLNPESKSVSERIDLVVDRRCSPDNDEHCDRTQRRKSRLQDLLVLSFPSACADVMSPPTSTEVVSSSPNDTEQQQQQLIDSKDDSFSTGTLLRVTSLSPVLGESGEPAQAKAENVVVDEDQEWFEDDYGLEATAAMTTLERESTAAAQFDHPEKAQQHEPVQHYQIYPFQDYFYIREIPNKPPPPYTPPGESSPGKSQQQQQSQSTAQSLPLLPFSGSCTPISSADFKRLSADVLAAVDYGRVRTVQLVDGALQCELGDCNIDGYFTCDDKAEDIANRSRRAHKQFVLQLVREIISTIREEDRRPPRKPWSKPEWPSRHRRRRTWTITSLNADEGLRAEVQRRVLPLLLSDAEEESPVTEESVAAQPDRRKKRDVVDEILLRELRKEESEWVDYDEDETTVKMQLSDSILNDLIGETVDALLDV